ncbi:MAG: hypothetical protein AAF733_06315 [Verrucomicrobiota bacterium]
MRSLLLALPFLIPSSILSAEGPLLKWHHSYEEALIEAKETRKPLFLEFRCAP